MRYKKTICMLYALVFIYFLSEYAAIPENIYMVAGENNSFRLNQPFKAELEADSVETLSINNKRVSENINTELGNEALISSDKAGVAGVKVKFLGLPVKKINLNFTPEKKVYAVGRAVGICVNSNGVLVLGTGKVKGENGTFYSPAENILKSGDIIKEINNVKINNKEELNDAVMKSPSSANIRFIRDGKEQSCTVYPVKSKDDNNKKLGIWVRDSTQGIGTITYYDSESKKFGALGHPINDVDTGKKIEIKDGEILNVTVDYAEKGQKGKPGSLQGTIDYNGTLGYVYENNDNGIYGTLTEEIKGKYVSVGYRNSISTGDAVILSNITSENVEEYTIHINSINRYNTSSNKNFVITITDKRLLDKTGGIVQGMSGCPIIQNGKLVGAVTHVFVNNPGRGYGIFIENML